MILLCICFPVTYPKERRGRGRKLLDSATGALHTGESSLKRKGVFILNKLMEMAPLDLAGQ